MTDSSADLRTPFTYAGAPGIFLLNQACIAVRLAFGPVYQVGSSVRGKAWRDVDVRAVVPDVRFKELFPGIGDTPSDHPAWSVTCTGITLWLCQASGLPVDFQIQSQSRADLEDGRRVELGVFATGGVL